jgi:histidyl-tRNA synthetase
VLVGVEPFAYNQQRMDTKLSTEAYKGTRDFYPEDMAVQRYIFDTWAKTAELFGFERYDASILEPSDLYKSKGAENEEMVNEQTYTFTDRGDREVTLRPEMTPTVARMIAARRRDLSFPVRWYSIPNLFRYERPQRGRLREHWQLNCDLFGAEGVASDVEVIALAAQTLTRFGATPDMFGIRVNHRGALNAHLAQAGITDDATIRAVTTVIDKKAKVSAEEFATMLTNAAGQALALPEETPEEVTQVLAGLTALGITNAVYDPSIVRGFSYYTGIVFEIFDTSKENNRALLGGGRYDNLTSLFGGDPVSGIGFGMGDVTMRDFLETHALLPDSVRTTGATLAILPTDTTHDLEAERIATLFRTAGIRTSVDLSTKKLGKKIGAASDAHTTYVLVVGETERATNTFTLKRLADSSEYTGDIATLIKHFG